MGSVYRFNALLTEEGWKSPAFVSLDTNGCVEWISDEYAETVAKSYNAIAIPGFQNAHSHAFQYAMAGVAERHPTGSSPDDFWSWREAMYGLALQMNPDQFERIATMLYAEMLRHGYTQVAEFHYVHHDKDGNQYSNLSEMGERLIAAAKKTGIGITLVPIFYQMGGFGKAPTDGQRRFISPNLDEYLKLYEASKKSCEYYEYADVALGIHSLRAVEPEIVARLCGDAPSDRAIHIHISEQLKEVEDALAFYGKRPVEWLLDNTSVDARFQLVHATHLTDDECDGIASRGGNVVLCPTTEGNLGDGIFPLRRFQSKGGKWSIGTDSHVSLNPLEELRLLDYGQRLTSHKRNTFYSSQQGDSGLYAIDMALKTGRLAMNNAADVYFKNGDSFDVVLFDAEAPLLKVSALENLASTLVYSTDERYQCGSISKGKEVVLNNQHKDEKAIRQDFVQSLTELASR